MRKPAPPSLSTPAKICSTATAPGRAATGFASCNFPNISPFARASPTCGKNSHPHPNCSSTLLVFIRPQPHRHPEGIHYLAQRGLRDPALIEELGIGYARGGNLRPHLSALGYSLERLFEVGLIGQQGQDAFCRRVIFPCRQYHRIVNLYGRSVGTAFPHRLLPRSKGGLFAWESVRIFATVILVEGFLDLAILWQAGFRNTTCAVGTQLTSAQLAQLSDRPGRFVYIVFDQDENLAGQKASHQLAPSSAKALASKLASRPVATRARPQQLLRCRRHCRSDFTQCLERTQPCHEASLGPLSSAPQAAACPYRLLDECKTTRSSG